MEWAAGTLHTTLELGVSSITTANAHTSDLNGLLLFAERRNLVSARVPSHFKGSLLLIARNPDSVIGIVIRLCAGRPRNCASIPE